MSYIGILLAAVLTWISFQIAFEPRPAGYLVHKNLFKVVAIGLLHGFSVLVASVGPFVWLGAALPAVQIMWVIMIASVIVMIIYYWKPVVEAINRYHGVATRKFIVV